MTRREYLKLDRQRRVTLPEEWFTDVVMVSLEPGEDGDVFIVKVLVRAPEGYPPPKEA